MRRILSILFLFFFSISIGQNINIVSFDSSAEYNPGSGVSVHFNPSGVFDFVNISDLQDSNNNSFVLELSGPDGDFSNPTVLNTAHDFYTSLINGIIPNDLVSGEYKLRIRSTQPELIQETDFFTVDNSTTNSSPLLSSNIESNSSYTQCLNDNVNVINPFFGSFNQNYNSLSGDMPSSNKFFTVTPTSDQNTIEVNIIDLSNGSSVSLNPISGNVYQIPENLSVGTYNIEVQETSPEGYSTFFSSAFIFHTSATIFGNASSETVCVGAEVTFNIDVGDLGIGSNSMGSYYIISFGDGSSDLILTQAELLELYSDPINPITHVFEQASCTEDGNTSFEVSFKLFNKGINAQCDNYSQNGLGASKEIATAEAPQSQFDLALEQCVNEDIQVFNTTIAGSYPAANGECGGDVDYSWLVKKPSFSDFLPVSLLSNSWVAGENLVIPAADVDEIGCWEIKLIAVNPAACLEESQFTGIINIEDIPEANFSPVGDLCENDIINLTGESNIIPVSCDFTLPGETPTYVWSVSPDSGYSLLSDSEDNPTTLESQNPIITFTEEGSYTLSLTVTTECGSDTHSETFNVLANPNVDFDLDSTTFCSTSSYLVDFSNELTPTYSDGFSAPTDYTWTVTGTDIDSNDYDFVNGTSSTDEFPIIQLNSFKTYDVTITVGSNCDVPDSDTIQITLNQQPTITNTITEQEICSGDESTQVDLVSDVENTTFSWETNENENLNGYLESGTTSFFPVQTIVNSSTEIQELEFTVTPTANGCTGDPFTYKIVVNPIPVVLDESITVCSGDPFTILPANDLESEIIPDGTTYSWTEPISDPAGLINGGASANDQLNISQTLINSSENIATMTYTVTPKYNGCVGDNFDVIVTVNPTIDIDPIPSQVLCNGEDTLDIEFNSSTENIVEGALITYSWTNDNTAIGLDEAGNGNIDSFTVTNNSVNQIVANISATSFYTLNEITCEGETEVFTIIVDPSPQVEFSEDDQFITSGETSTEVDLTSSTENVSISWTAVADLGIQGLVNLSGTNSISEETLINTLNEPQSVVYTAVASGDTSDCDGIPVDYTITVNPLAQVNPVDDEILCNGDNLVVEFTSIVTGGEISYLWTNDNTDIGLADEGSGNLDFIVTNNSEESITANITVTPTFTNGDNSNEGDPINFSITVNPSAQVDNIDDINVSNGTLIGLIEFTTLNTGGTTTYEWTNDNTDIGLVDSGNESIPEFTAVNDGDIPITGTIEVTPILEENGVICTGDSETFTITVNPDAQVNEIDDLVYNDGDLVQIPFTSSNTGGDNSYEWTSTNSETGLEDSGSGDIEFTATNTLSNSPIVTTVTVIPTFTNGDDSNSGEPETFTITVNPVAQIEPMEDITLCEGEELETIIFSTLNTGGTTTYEWINDNTDIGLAANGVGDIPSFAVTNDTTSTLIATIEVTPTYENGGVSNTGNSETFTITVNPGAQVEAVTSQVLCVGESTDEIVFDTINTDGTTTYEWTNDNTDIGLAANGVGDIPSFTVTNDTTSALIATIEVTPTYENNGIICSGNPEIFTITVLSEITITFDITDAIDCDNPNSGIIDITVSGGSGVYEFIWSDGSINEDLIGVTSGDYSVTITDSEGCIFTSQLFNIFRQEDLVVDLTTQISAVCETSLVTQQNNISISGGLPPYEINWSAGAVTLGDNTEMTAYENGVYNVIVTDQYGCEVDTEIIVDFDELSITGASFDYISSGNLDCGLSIFNEIEFTNTSDGDVLDVTWDFGDGSAPVSGEIVTHQYITAGEFEVTITAQYNYGCIEVYTEEIVVSNGYDIMLPTAFSPNNDGINDTIRPVYNCVNDINMSVYDTFGSLLYYENNIELQGWNGMLDGKKAENGNYLIVVNGTTIFGEEINLNGVFVLLR
jgi:gliding motility-associated-like protein